MMDWLSEYVFNSLIGWIGVGGLTIAGLVAVAWFFPPLRTYATAAASAIGAALFVYGKGYRDAKRKQDELEQERERRATEEARQARTAGERDAAAGVRDAYDRDRM